MPDARWQKKESVVPHKIKNLSFIRDEILEMHLKKAIKNVLSMRQERNGEAKSWHRETI